MAKVVPGGFQVLPAELYSAADQLAQLNVQLFNALQTLSGWADASKVETMEDDHFLMSNADGACVPAGKPGAAFDAFWKASKPQAQTLADDLMAAANAINAAASHYDGTDTQIYHHMRGAE